MKCLSSRCSLRSFLSTTIGSAASLLALPTFIISPNWLMVISSIPKQQKERRGEKRFGLACFQGQIIMQRRNICLENGKKNDGEEKKGFFPNKCGDGIDLRAPTIAGEREKNFRRYIIATDWIGNFTLDSGNIWLFPSHFIQLSRLDRMTLLLFFSDFHAHLGQSPLRRCRGWWWQQRQPLWLHPPSHTPRQDFHVLFSCGHPHRSW